MLRRIYLKNWCFWIVVLKTLGRPLDCKEIKSVNPKRNQSWIFTGRNDAEVEAPIIWPPDVKNWLLGKDPGAKIDWRQEKGTTEDEMVGWHHWLNGDEIEWTPGVGDGQGGLVCCSPWGSKELDKTEWLNWTDKDYKQIQLIHPKGNQCWIFTEGLMLKMTLQDFHLMQRTDSLKKTLMLGKIEGRRRRQQGMR